MCAAMPLPGMLPALNNTAFCPCRLPKEEPVIVSVVPIPPVVGEVFDCLRMMLTNNCAAAYLHAVMQSDFVDLLLPPNLR